MAEFERVPIRPRPARDWLPTAGIVAGILLVLVIVKPWDLARPATADGPSAQPTFFVRPTERTGPRDYDPRLFGGREPDPAWELWPAGYVVQFGLAGPLKVTGQDGPSAAPPGPSAEPSSATPAATASAVPAATTASGELPTGTIVDLGPADHLVALGINTPLDARISSVRLVRTDTRGGPKEVAIVRLPTLWESNHFVVIAPEDRADPGQPAPWLPGLYQLELTTVFGDVRIVDLVIRPPLAVAE